MATLAEVQKRLEEIRDMGYIPTTRRGPTGIGHTFETYIGLDETNLQIPDIGGRIEIKTARGNSGSLITIPRRESPPFQGWDERRASWLRLLDIEDQKGK